MECNKTKSLLVDLMEDSLISEDKNMVVEHIKKCASCRQEYESLKEIITIIRHGAKLHRKQITIPNMEDKLREAFKREGKILTKRRPLFISSAVATVVLLLFFITINISPVVACYLNQIPVVHEIVQLGLIDKGLVKAVEGDKGQLIEKSGISNNIKFTVHEIIAGENRTAIFFSMDGFSGVKEAPEIHSMLVNNGGKSNQKTVGVFRFDKENQRITGVFEFKPIKGLFSKVEVVIPEIMADDEIKRGPWQVSFYVDKNKAREKRAEFTVNKEVTINNEKIKILDIVVTPIDTIVSFEASNSTYGESRKSIGSDDSLKGTNELNNEIVLVDQKGNQYSFNQKNVSNGKGYWMFSLTYPDKPSKIIIGDTQQTVFLK